MSLDMVLAVSRGYQDRQVDFQCLAVQIGYWAAYYTNGGKKAKKPLQVIRGIRKQQYKAAHTQQHVDDIQPFDELEAMFNSRLQGGEYLNG